MKIVSVNKDNINEEHVCCAIGNDKQNQKRAESKKEWMMQCFDDGLVFKKFDQRGKIFIEYLPIEKAWKPVAGKNYMLINCLWVSGQFKGKGLSRQLLDECIEDAKNKKMNGLVVVSAVKTKPFLTDKSFFIKHGFEVIDTAPPYFELLALKFNANSEDPKFTEHAKSGLYTHKNGFAFVYSNQCPFMEEYVGLLSEIAKKNGIEVVVKRLKTYKEAQETGSPFGTFGLYYEGVFQTHELMSEKKFEKFIEQLKK